MPAHIVAFASQLLDHRAHIGVGETVRRSSVNVMAEGFHRNDEHRNVGHRANVNVLLNGVADESLVHKEMVGALQCIARHINAQTRCEHLQRSGTSDGPIGVRCPRPVEQRFECEQIGPVHVQHLKHCTPMKWLPARDRRPHANNHSQSPTTGRAVFVHRSNFASSLPIESIRSPRNKLARPTIPRFAEVHVPANRTKFK